MSSLRLPATLENLSRFITFVENAAKTTGFNGLRLREIELCTEEAIVNIINHAYSGEDGYIEITCRDEGERGLAIEIIDWGKPFDIKSIPMPEINADVIDRKIGGLGIFFINELMDEVKYRRGEDRNILTLVVYRQ